MGKKPKTNEDVDKELKEKFGNEFIRIGDYVNSSTYIEFKHTKCGNHFKQRLNRLQSGKCTKCCNRGKQRTYDELCEEIKNAGDYYGEYTLLSSKYDIKGKKGEINANKIGKFYHDKCKSEFTMRIRHFLDGERCNSDICKTNKLKTTEEFKEELNKIYNGNFILESEYINKRSKVTVRCKKCNSIITDYAFNFRVNYRGCPNCKESYGEQLIINYLESKNISYEYNKIISSECKNKYSLKFDFIIKNHNLIIEYDGEQHFKQILSWDFELAKYLDCIKNNYCRSNNLTLLRISYLNFKNITTILNTIFESSTTRETINSINDIMYISKDFEVINGIYKGVSYSSS